MQLKKIISLLLIFILCFSLCACEEAEIITPFDTSSPSSSNEPESSAKSSPLLYKVTDKSGNVLWLFGSIHVGRDEFYPLPDYVTDAFNSADKLAVEFDIVSYEKDMSAQMQTLRTFLYTDGTTIKDHVSEDAYNKAVKILTDANSYVSMFDQFNASLWTSFLDSILIEKIGADTELGIDRHLINKAFDDKKEIVDVESAESQYEMLAGFSEELQVFLFNETLSSFDDEDLAKKEVTEMMDLWAAGDEKGFAEYLSAEENNIPKEQTALYEEYNKAMMTDRNASMTDFAENALKSGEEIFMCVGAAHIVGEGAIAQNLKQLGYTVECITK